MKGKLAALVLAVALVCAAPAGASSSKAKVHGAVAKARVGQNDYCGTADGGFVNYYGIVIFDRWAYDNWVITPGADPNATGVEHLVSRHYWLFTVQFGYAGVDEDVTCWIYW